MDDDKIKDLFSNFNPTLSSSARFMERLQKNMEIVDMIRSQNQAMRRRNRLAVAIAGISGFAMGVVMTLLFPTINGWLASLSALIISNFSMDIPMPDSSQITWSVIAAVCVLTSLSVYELAMSGGNARGAYSPASRPKESR